MRRVLAGLLSAAAIFALIALAWGAAVLYVQAAAALHRPAPLAPLQDGVVDAVSRRQRTLHLYARCKLTSECE
jgi:hypothetical protein